VILATVAAVILFLGVASPLFTRRMEASTDNVLKQMERVRDASRPADALPSAVKTSRPLIPPAEGSFVKVAEKRVRP
jgi:hypothetical protein